MSTHPTEEALLEARHTAAQWHGGQWSALYAFTSSGAVLPGATREARKELEAGAGRDDIDAGELAALEELAEVLEALEPRPVEVRLEELELGAFCDGIISDVSATVWSHRTVYPPERAATIDSGPERGDQLERFYVWRIDLMTPAAAAELYHDATTRYVDPLAGAVRLSVSVDQP